MYQIMVSILKYISKIRIKFILIYLVLKILIVKGFITSSDWLCLRTFPHTCMTRDWASDYISILSWSHLRDA